MVLKIMVTALELGDFLLTGTLFAGRRYSKCDRHK